MIHNFRIQISKRNKKTTENTKKTTSNIKKKYQKNVAKVSRYFTNLPYQLLPVVNPKVCQLNSARAAVLIQQCTAVCHQGSTWRH